MIVTEYYRSYEGPELIICTVGDENLTDQIREFYGSDRRWKNRLHTYGELFGPDSVGKTVRMEFLGNDGRTHWFYNYVHDLESYCLCPKAIS